MIVPDDLIGKKWDGDKGIGLILIKTAVLARNYNWIIINGDYIINMGDAIRFANSTELVTKPKKVNLHGYDISKCIEFYLPVKLNTETGKLEIIIKQEKKE